MKLPVRPMLAQKIAGPKNDVFPWPFDVEGWTFEPKLDGHRLIAVVDAAHRPTLYSRSGRVEDSYPSIHEACRALDPGVYDGEVCWMLDGIRTSRQRLANIGSATPQQISDSLRYVVFDCLELNSVDMQSEPLEVRRDAVTPMLYRVRNQVPIAMIAGTPDGIALWQVVEQLSLEGLIAKPLQGRYKQGERASWKKVKRLVREQYTIVGWTAGTNAREGMIGALVLAEQQNDGTFRYVGKVGTGFNDDTLVDLQRTLSDYTVIASPFGRAQALRAKTHIGPKEVTWVRPAVRCEIEFSDWSEDGTPIFPSFKGVVW